MNSDKVFIRRMTEQRNTPKIDCIFAYDEAALNQVPPRYCLYHLGLIFNIVRRCRHRPFLLHLFFCFDFNFIVLSRTTLPECRRVTTCLIIKKGASQYRCQKFSICSFFVVHFCNEICLLSSFFSVFFNFFLKKSTSFEMNKKTTFELINTYFWRKVPVVSFQKLKQCSPFHFDAALGIAFHRRM